MKYILLLLIMPIFLNAQQFNGRHIKLHIKSLKNAKMYLGTYYEKKRIVADSTLIDQNGNGAFYNKQKFTQGVYFLVTPSLNALQDFIIGPQQEFLIESDTSFNEPIKIVGSPDNDLFLKYNDYMNEKGKSMKDIEISYAEAGVFNDSNERRKNLVMQYNVINREMKDYREKLVKDNPDAFLSMLLNVSKRPEVPAIPIINGKPDSSYPYRYIKAHFWDETEFNDERLIRTPFFEEKIDEYFDRLVPKDPDSIIKEVRFIMAYARSNKEMFSYFLNKFTNKFWFPKYLGEDKVFIFLFENYFSKGDTVYVTAESRKNVRERYFKLVGNFVGNKAVPINLKDTSGVPISLYNVQAPLVFLVFYNPTCGHCRTQIPRVDSFYRANWKSKRVVIFAVNVGREIPVWKDFIKEFKLKGWYNGYEPEADEISEAKQGRSFRQSFDIHSTPMFFLLDKDKRIIGKELSLEQYDDLINVMTKKYNNIPN